MNTISMARTVHASARPPKPPTANQKAVSRRSRRRRAAGLRASSAAAADAREECVPVAPATGVAKAESAEPWCPSASAGVGHRQFRSSRICE
jgi:hypothetical protein